MRCGSVAVSASRSSAVISSSAAITRSSSGVSTCGASCATNPMRAPAPRADRRVRLAHLLADQPQQRRLARAVAPDQPHLPALGDERRGVLEQRPPADAVGEVGDFQHRGLGCRQCLRRMEQSSRSCAFRGRRQIVAPTQAPRARPNDNVDGHLFQNAAMSRGKLCNSATAGARPLFVRLISLAPLRR